MLQISVVCYKELFLQDWCLTETAISFSLCNSSNRAYGSISVLTPDILTRLLWVTTQQGKEKYQYLCDRKREMWTLRNWLLPIDYCQKFKLFLRKTTVLALEIFVSRWIISVASWLCVSTWLDNHWGKQMSPGHVGGRDATDSDALQTVCRVALLLTRRHTHTDTSSLPSPVFPCVLFPKQHWGFSKNPRVLRVIKLGPCRCQQNAASWHPSSFCSQQADEVSFFLKLKLSPSWPPLDLLPAAAAEHSTEPLEPFQKSCDSATRQISRGQGRGEGRGRALRGCLAAKSTLEISVGSSKAFPNIKNAKKKKKFWSMAYCPWSKQKNPSQSEITEICFIVRLKFSMFWQLGLMLLAGLFASPKIFISELPGFCPFKLNSNDEGEGAGEIWSMSSLP